MADSKHIPFDGTDEQRANLGNLAGYLEALPVGYTEFDMSFYDSSTAKPSKANRCGSVACACGHGPRAGIQPLETEGWDDYSKRAFGVIDAQNAWSWCFGAVWEDTDNTPHGAAARIRYMLANGTPTDGYDQSVGLAPLSYAVPA